MKISLILNTACMDPIVAMRHNTYRNAKYMSRIDMLECTIEQVEGFDEIIVVGNYKVGTGYKYIEVPPHVRTRADGLIQREVGARHATGDVFVFCHDDHCPGYDSVDILRKHYSYNQHQNDLLIPKRVHHKTNAELNNGREDDYMGGHCLAMHRSLWAEVPWTSTDLIFWDVVMTRLWREAGANLIWHDKLIHYDLEAAENED